MGLTAAISLNLGIFNLLPIPILDGGVILFLLIEGLMRRDISMNIKERVYQAAFVFLVLFAVDGDLERSHQDDSGAGGPLAIGSYCIRLPVSGQFHSPK